MKILFVASESSPYCTSGGLGGVVGTLPRALSRAGHEVKVCIPLYRQIDRARHGIESKGAHCVHMGKGEIWCGRAACDHGDGVEAWFVEHGEMFGRGGMYDEGGNAYPDNLGRFAYLSKAALQFCKDTDWIPDVVHAHDWPTAAAVVFRKTWDAWYSPLEKTATVLTIHNIGYQGTGEKGVLDFMGIGPEHFTPNKFEDYGRVNFLKAGIHFADAITTVSPTHAQEIRTPDGGKGLAMYLNDRGGDVFGILNGIDYRDFDSATDKLLPAHFTTDDLSGKAECKRALQERMGLWQDPARCLIGLVSRFVSGKGLDLVQGMMERALREMHVQVVFLGSGDPAFHAYLADLQARFPGQVANWIGYDEGLAHQIYAGSDLYLMPSGYEPCGLSQLYAMRYGSLPVVRRTGGLADTVWNYQEWDGGGTGFVFDEYRAESLYYTLGWAVSTYFDRRGHFVEMQKRAMAPTFSWERTVPEYERVYEHALSRVRG